jgi:hypothetical protein
MHWLFSMRGRILKLYLTLPGPWRAIPLIAFSMVLSVMGGLESTPERSLYLANWSVVMVAVICTLKFRTIGRTRFGNLRIEDVIILLRLLVRLLKRPWDGEDGQAAYENWQRVSIGFGTTRKRTTIKLAVGSRERD